MPPTRIADEVVTEIKNIWAEIPEKLSALAVWREYDRRTGHRKLIGKRKVQQIVAEARKNARTDEAFPVVEWQPWTNEEQSPELIDHLLQLDAACVATYRRHLYQHEARGACRLRVALSGLSPRGQLAIIREYARRESLAFYLRSDRPYTADLDGLVAYKPWLPQNYAIYHYAAITGNIPVLQGSALWELIERPEMYLENDPALPALAKQGYLPGTWFLSGLNFNTPVPEGYATEQSNFQTPEDFLEWLRLTVAEFWAGRPPTPEISETEGVINER